MKTTVLLVVLLFFLQYRLWIGDGSLSRVAYLKSEIQLLQKEISQLTEKNRVIIADIVDLKHGNEVIEEYARNELGMIKKDELFYQLVTRRPHTEK